MSSNPLTLNDNESTRFPDYERCEFDITVMLESKCIKPLAYGIFYRENTLKIEEDDYDFNMCQIANPVVSYIITPMIYGVVC